MCEQNRKCKINENIFYDRYTVIHVSCLSFVEIDEVVIQKLNQLTSNKDQKQIMQGNRCP